jgi:ABC-type Mn2+/Zn2+ transport system ATPase subunit
MSLGKLLEHVQSWKLTSHEKKIAGELVEEIQKRLSFLNEVGLEYLALGRSANTLSGGEAQRIRLAAQLGSGLCGVLYVLDEPTIGLHPRDNHRLISAMHRLRDHGNTLVVVEHDRDVIASSDRLCDFGPGSGHLGGEIVNEFSPNEKKRLSQGVTGPYLINKKAIPIPSNRRPVDSSNPKLTIRDAHMHTLRHLDVSIPLGRFTAIAGPSGSGKSSLINGILYPALARRLHRAHATPGPHHSIDGTKSIDKVVRVDQSPLGNSPSSTPATYTGVFDDIRNVFAKLPQAKANRLTARDFSFNVAGGRCEKCEGNGQCRIEMHFLPDVWVECDSCHGDRYQSQVLDVLYRGKSINDVLNMSIVQAKELFAEEARIMRVLNILDDVGLGYMSLGQAAPTLSGGEAQRVKLAADLARPSTGRTLYLFDEPTTGLHFDDIQKLLYVFHRLVDQGNTVVVIEHNLDVIKTADWVIELGPEAGWDGGQLVFAGTPEDLVAYAKSVPSANGSAKPQASKRARTKKKTNTAQVVSTHLTSHTGIALEPVLAAGRYEEQERLAAPLEVAPDIPSLASAARQDPIHLMKDLLRVPGITPDMIMDLVNAAIIPQEFRSILEQVASFQYASDYDDDDDYDYDDDDDDYDDALYGGEEVASCIVDVMTEFETFDFVATDDDQFKVFLESNSQTFTECRRDDRWVHFTIHLDTDALANNPPPPIRASHQSVKYANSRTKNAYSITHRNGFSALRFTLDSSSQLDREAFSQWLSEMAYSFQERHDGVYFEAE